MDITKQELIAAFIEEVILNEEFFDALYEVLEEEVDLEDEENEEVLTSLEDAFSSALEQELAAFMDKNFTEQELQELAENPESKVQDKFDALSEEFNEIIAKNTEEFVSNIVQELGCDDEGCEEEKDSCCS